MEMDYREPDYELMRRLNLSLDDLKKSMNGMADFIAKNVKESKMVKIGGKEYEVQNVTGGMTIMCDGWGPKDFANILSKLKSAKPKANAA